MCNNSINSSIVRVFTRDWLADNMAHSQNFTTTWTDRRIHRADNTLAMAGCRQGEVNGCEFHCSEKKKNTRETSVARK